MATNRLLIDLGKILTEKQIDEIAKSIGLKYYHLKAIVEVETSGRGFYKVNNLFETLIPIVRFENHKFSLHTDHRYDERYPSLSSRTYTNKFNRVGIQEYNRFEEAYALDGKAAVYATSWGLGQIMGENWEQLGYKTLTDFLNAAYNSERTQLEMIGFFLVTHHKPMIDYLIRGEYDLFAKYYNGPNYAINDYHNKLKTAVNKYK